MRTRLAILSIAVLAVAACSNSKNVASTSGADQKASKTVTVDQPGVTSTEIRVGGIASITNPIGADQGAVFDGTQAFFDMVNASGGIYGRKLVLADKLDDKLVSNSQAVSDMLTRVKPFAVLPVASLLFSGANQLAASGTPTFGQNYSEDWASTPATPKPNLFGHAGSVICADCLNPGLVWVLKTMGRTKVGVLAFNIPQAAGCVKGAKDSLAKWGGQAGLSFAFEDSSIAFGASDFSAQVARMKSAGVDSILVCMDVDSAISVAKEVKKQGLDAKFTLLQGYDPKLPEQYSDLFAGSYVLTYFEPFETAKPSAGLADFLKWTGKSGKKPIEVTMIGWLNAKLFYDGLKAAGPQFTQAKVIAAINKMINWTGDGLVGGVDWRKAHTSADSYCYTAVTPKDGKFVPVLVTGGHPFNCWSDRNAADLPAPTHVG